MKKFALSFLILAAGLAFWISGRMTLLQTRRAVADASARLAQQDNRLAADEARLAVAQQQGDDQSNERILSSAALTSARQKLAVIDPECQWAKPPASLPEWHSASPYFWTTKESLAGLGVKVFETNGCLNPQIAAVLGIEEPVLGKLNGQLTRAIADFRTLKRSSARLSDDPAKATGVYESIARRAAEWRREMAELRAHWPDMEMPKEPADASRAADGPTRTVTMPATSPAQGEALRAQLIEILDQYLGQQPTKLALELADKEWPDEAWGWTGRFGLELTVLRHPDGTYLFGSSNGGFGVGMPASEVSPHIPEYLLPLFTDFLIPSSGGDAVADPTTNDSAP